MLSIKETIKIKDTKSVKREPVLVYNSRVDSLLDDMSKEAKKLTITDVTVDWLLFIDEINSKMFEKISF